MLLEDLGVFCDVLKPVVDKWFDLLMKYNDSEGSCKVPWIYEINGEDLGEWLDTRQHAMKKKDKLDGFVWGVFLIFL